MASHSGSSRHPVLLVGALGLVLHSWSRGRQDRTGGGPSPRASCRREGDGDLSCGLGLRLDPGRGNAGHLTVTRLS